MLGIERLQILSDEVGQLGVRRKKNASDLSSNEMIAAIDYETQLLQNRAIGGIREHQTGKVREGLEGEVARAEDSFHVVGRVAGAVAEVAIESEVHLGGHLDYGIEGEK